MQLSAVRDDRARYEDAGVSVFGVNNGGADSHRSFVEKHGLTAPLLVDKHFEVAAKYDAVMNIGLLKLIRRTVVGIDRGGKIAFYERGTPSTDEIIAAVAPGG